MLYEATISAFTQQLNALSAILDKAAAHAEAKKIDPLVLTSARLAPDMLPLTRQVLIACDFAKNTSGRLAGGEIPKFADDEKTFEELKARIAKTLGYIAQIDAAKIEAAAGRDIEFTIGPNKMKMEAAAYALRFALPNFYFHSTTAYDILRHNGVELGKRDFMGTVAGLNAA
eukprot:gene6251-6319_t